MTYFPGSLPCFWFPDSDRHSPSLARSFCGQIPGNSPVLAQAAEISPSCSPLSSLHIPLLSCVYHCQPRWGCSRLECSTFSNCQIHLCSYNSKSGCFSATILPVSNVYPATLRIHMNFSLFFKPNKPHLYHICSCQESFIPLGSAMIINVISTVASSAI